MANAQPSRSYRLASVISYLRSRLWAVLNLCLFVPLLSIGFLPDGKLVGSFLETLPAVVVTRIANLSARLLLQAIVYRANPPSIQPRKRLTSSAGPGR